MFDSSVEIRLWSWEVPATHIWDLSHCINVEFRSRGSASKHRNTVKALVNIGVLIIRIGFWGPL